LQLSIDFNNILDRVNRRSL